jgi:GNAT superfamily N-acetyltransferase
MKNTITIELIEPFPAWAQKLERMQKQFTDEYDGTAESSKYSRKERIKIGMSDIEKKYVFWIILNNKEKIGYILAPTQSDPDTGEKKGRYIDTRFIVPTHRGKGYGTQALDRLCEFDYVDNVKVNWKHMMQNFMFWFKKGWGHAVMAGAVDPNFRIELEQARDNPAYDKDYLHWYIMRSDSPQLEMFRKAKVPIMDFTKARIKEEA